MFLIKQKRISQTICSDESWVVENCLLSVMPRRNAVWENERQIQAGFVMIWKFAYLAVWPWRISQGRLKWVCSLHAVTQQVSIFTKIFISTVSVRKPTIQKMQFNIPPENCRRCLTQGDIFSIEQPATVWEIHDYFAYIIQYISSCIAFI